MSLSETVGRNIVFVRKKIGVTQEWLSLESEVALSYLRSIEHGEANPSVDLISRLASALQVPTTVLFSENIEDSFDELAGSVRSTRATENEILFIHYILETSLCSVCQNRVEAERVRFKQSHIKSDVSLLTNYIGRK